MPEPTTEPLALEATALRFAARTLPPREAAQFEERLATDQDARDALSEAIRLSAAALNQDEPFPGSSVRRGVRNRLASRFHPFTVFGLGAGSVAAAALFAGSLSDRPVEPAPMASSPLPPPPAPSPEPVTPIAIAKPEEPEPPVENPEDMRKAAEIWAELSTPDHVERTHEDESKLQQRFKNLRPASGLDSREP